MVTRAPVAVRLVVVWCVVAVAPVLADTKRDSSSSSSDARTRTESLMALGVSVIAAAPHITKPFEKRIESYGYEAEEMFRAVMLGFSLWQNVYNPPIMFSLNFEILSQNLDYENKFLGELARNSRNKLFLHATGFYLGAGPCVSWSRRFDWRMGAVLNLGYRRSRFVFLDNKPLELDSVLSYRQLATELTRNDFFTGIEGHLEWQPLAKMVVSLRVGASVPLLSGGLRGLDDAKVYARRSPLYGEVSSRLGIGYLF